ncbi:cytochrome-c oxidase, subunit VIIa [Terfezia boudieri ATCC MYA-4762]|uniref:Cytochrome c oxidase subunit 9, mitochondrial n=1 Tax=Terfezia boudieri ATCC MYA-4762 TaxID=1051890 RepID=A0A3N4LTG9_9PEZI|nr:cytochrome-c oxidase, subunit VIIa [Terfezia boudieri ATCC MYA-4762]
MIQPIVGRLRRGLIMDLSVAMGLGMGFGYYFWYGYHVPSIRRRDALYAKLERERAAALQG